MVGRYNGASLALYVRPGSPQGHRVRLVLAEKGVFGYDVVEVHEDNEDLAAINPYNTTPTLTDRDLVLYEPRTILEYLEERYPQPPLMPADPAQRARYRMVLHRLETEMYVPCADMERSSATVRKARTHMRDALVRFAGDALPCATVGSEYSLLDCTLAPILWRMDHYRLHLPQRPERLLRDYARGLFRREAFVASLSTHEDKMRCKSAD